MVTSFILNSIVIRTFRMNMCLRKLHDVLILHFAVFNIITSLGSPVYMLFFTSSHVMFQQKYVCLLGFLPVNVGTSVSVIILLALAFERFFVIKYPFTHRKVKPYQANICVISMTFVIVCFLMLPVFGWNKWESKQICVVDAFPSEFLYIGTVGGLLLMLTNLYLHIFVLKTSFALSHCITEWQDTKDSKYMSIRKSFVRNARALKTVFFLAVISTVCWLPYNLFTFCFLLLKFSPNDWPYLWQCLILLWLLNASTMPIVFGMRNRHFRSALKGTMLRRHHECRVSFTMT